MRMVDQSQGITSCRLEGVLGHQLLCHRLEGKRREGGGGQLHRAKGACKGFRHRRFLSPVVWDEMRAWSLHSVTLPHIRNQFVWNAVSIIPIPIQRFLEGPERPCSAPVAERYTGAVCHTSRGVWGSLTPIIGILWWLAVEGPSMYDLTIDDFPPDRLAAIVHWRNDPAVNRYLRQGILTLETVQAWYTQYFSRAEHQLFAVYADKALIGYGSLSHIDTTHRSGEIGIV